MKNPNILVFVTDQHRADWLSCMGNQVLQTPNIDAIAREGVVFDRAYCNTPLCMPSRATMWTGLHASEHGARTNGVDLDEAHHTLPEILRENGYKTISVGKLHLKSWHMAPGKGNNIKDYDPDLFPECETVWNRGSRTKLPDNYFGLEVSHFLGGHGSYCFGEYVNWLKEKHPEVHEAMANCVSDRPTTGKPDNYYSTVPNELYYNEWIKDLTIKELDRTDERPFFLWCSFPDPHFPFGPPKPYSEMYSKEDVPDPIAWDDPRDRMNEFYHTEYYEARGEYSVDGGPSPYTLEQIKETKALAWGLVRSVDDSVGAVMEHLKKTGKLEDTVVVFLADHGELMGDHGLYCKGPFHYEGLLRVPMVISYPKKLRRGLHTEALASILDFMPTLLDLAGVEYPENPVKDWEGPFEHEHIYEGVPRLPGKSLVPLMDGTAEKVQDSLLVEDDDDIRHVNVRTLITPRYKLTVYAEKPYGELFDLEADPEERKNLWDDPAYRDLRAQLSLKLIDQLVQSQERIKRRIGIA